VIRISKVEPFIVDIGPRNLVFVRILTDQDLYGVGEAYSVGPDLATARTIAYFADWIVGMNPFDIEAIWQKLYIGSRFPGGSVVNAAISGIDQALWDIKGKALDVPVYELLGGRCRDRIRVYQNPGGSTPEETTQNAVELIQEFGFTAIKTNPLPPNLHEIPWSQALREAERKLDLLRQTLGEDIDIALDPHARILEPARAIQLCEVVAPYRPLFVEEPLRPENIDALKSVHRRSPAPIATGEMLYTKWQFRDLLRAQAVDIIQPDICCCGGVTEMKKISALAEAEYVSIAPHHPLGPVATAVNAQFAATAPNFLILEYHVDVTSPRRDLVLEPYIMEGGYLELPNKPGLGIELNLDYVLSHPYRSWHRPFLYHKDGSLSFI